MQSAGESLSVEGVSRWAFRVGETAKADRASRNVQLFRWLEAIQAEAVSGAGEVDAEIAAELRRLDAKLSIVLELLMDRSGLTNDVGASPQGSAYSLSVTGVGLQLAPTPGAAYPAVGDIGILEWHPEPRWPSMLRFAARVTAASAPSLYFEFVELEEAERDALERWIFREHRRARERYR